MRIDRSNLELKAAAFSEFSKRKRDLVGIVDSVMTISVIVRTKCDGVGIFEHVVVWGVVGVGLMVVSTAVVDGSVLGRTGWSALII